MVQGLDKTERKKRTHYVPRTRYPIRIERWYAKKIVQMVRQWQKVALRDVNIYLRPFVLGGNALKQDASDDPNNASQPSWADELVTYLTFMKRDVLYINASQELAKQFLNSMDRFSYTNSKQQIAKIRGINPIDSDAQLKALVKFRIGENVKLISRLQDDFINGLQIDIYESITKGKGISAITQDIVKRGGYSTKHAQMIARDQTGSIIADLNSYRAKSAGAKKYIWESSEDDRVRPLHAKLDGTVQRFDDPNGGDHGEIPGQPINCRCFFTPIYD